MSKVKLSKEAKQEILKLAKSMPGYCLLDAAGNFIPARQSTKGSELIKQGITQFTRESKIKGPNKSFKTITIEETIKPDEFYLQDGLLLSDPIKYLETAVKKGGSQALPEAVKKYHEQSAISNKKLADLKNKKDESTPTDIPESKEVS